MSNTKVVMSQASNQYVAPTFIEDVFSTYLYTGNSSTQTITNDIDLAGEGGLVWIKSRSNADPHLVFDTDRGVNKFVNTNTAAAEQNKTGTLTSFNADGFSLGSTNEGQNFSGLNYASWTFRKAPRFFEVVTYTGDGASQTISHNLGAVPGVVIVKDYSGSGNSWTVYHRSIGNTGGLLLNDTNSTITSTTFFNDTDPTDTAFTVGSATNTNASGRSFVAYLFAHDPLGPSGDGSDGLIACGNYTGTGAAGQIATLGWEPQWVMIKAANTATDWHIYDNMRGMTTLSDGTARLLANNNGAESILGGASSVFPTATGFGAGGGISGVNQAGGEYIYIAIRRGPMRAPESGTEVFATATRTGTGTAPAVIDVGFPPDMAFNHQRTVTSGEPRVLFGGRILGGGRFETTSTNGYNDSGYPSDFDVREWGQTTLSLGTNWVDSGREHVNHVFRRAPEFFDVVAYTGNGTAGRTVPHNLGVAPEMMIVKRRSSSGSWFVYVQTLTALKNLRLNASSMVASDGNALWNSTDPTDTAFTLGNNQNVNASGSTYIAYLFSTLAGISKVGSYTGNGTSQTINCGFTTGARLVLIKATSTTGDWMIADTARGIVAGNDPYLELNTTNAEVTSEDWLDPDSSGFVVNEVAGSNANTSGVSYIFYAVA